MEPSAVVTPRRPPADLAVRSLLRIPDRPTTSTDAAQRAFSRSMLISATRCTLTYVVLPFLAPLLGVAAGVGPVLGLVIGVAAIVSNVVTIRRFWAADHRWRWAYSGLALGVMILVAVLVAGDVAALLG